MVALIGRMLELNKKKHSGAVAAIYDRRKSVVEHSSTRQQVVEHSSTLQLDREIASTDAEIDELVYELYGITDEERKIVEGNL